MTPDNEALPGTVYIGRLADGTLALVNDEYATPYDIRRNT